MTRILFPFQYILLSAVSLPNAAGRTAMPVPALVTSAPSPALPAGEGASPAWIPLAAIAFLAILLLLKLLETITLLLLASRQQTALKHLQDIKNSVVGRQRKRSSSKGSKATSTGTDGPEYAEKEPDPKASLNHLPERLAEPPQEQMEEAAEPPSPAAERSVFSEGQTFQENRFPVPSSPVCHLSVNKGIHLNPNLPVTFDTGEGSAFLLELHSGNTIVPEQKCFAGYNTASFFTSNDFFLVFHFISTSGQTIIHPGRPLRILSVEKPARAGKEGTSYILKEKGVLRVSEK